MSQELGGASDGPDISCIYKADGISRNDLNHTEDSYSDRDIDEPYSMKENGSTAMKGKEMSIEYLENDVDVFHGVDDWDGTDLLLFFHCLVFFFTTVLLLQSVHSISSKLELESNFNIENIEITNYVV